jgi:putative membrane protein
MNRNQIMNARMCTRLLTLAGVVVFASASAVAQGNMNGGAHSTMSPGNTGEMAGQNGGMNGMAMGSSAAGSMQDKTFAKKALAGGMAEVQLGQLAEQKGNSEDVKQFGQRMVDDHTKLNDQMKPIAASIGVQPPMGLTPKDKALMTKLQGLSGDAFDKAYIKAMLKDHKEDNKAFEMEASSGQNQQEKDAAMQGDQVIKEHLKLVEQLAKTHDVMGGSKASM